MGINGITMKYFYFIFLFLISIKVHSSPIGSVVYGLYIGSIASWVTYEAVEGGYYKANDGLYFSMSTDLKMFSELHLDNQIKFSCKYDRINLHSEFESCVWAEFEAVTAGIDYIIFNRKLAFMAGGITGVIFNQDKTSWTYGIESEVRLWSKGNYSLSYCNNLIARPELMNPAIKIFGQGFVYNGYIQFNAKIFKNYNSICNDSPELRKRLRKNVK